MIAVLFSFVRSVGWPSWEGEDRATAAVGPPMMARGVPAPVIIVGRRWCCGSQRASWCRPVASSTSRWPLFLRIYRWMGGGRRERENTGRNPFRTRARTVPSSTTVKQPTIFMQLNRRRLPNWLSNLLLYIATVWRKTEHHSSRRNEYSSKTKLSHLEMINISSHPEAMW